jgi:hypothetical protein
VSARRATSARPARALALLALVAPPALAGCGHALLQGREAARGPLAVATPEDVPVCGHRATVEVAAGPDGAEGPDLQGELLAATAEAVVVLDVEGVHTVPAAAVKRLLVQVRPSRSGRTVGLAALGAVSTVSNGVFLIFTFPLWIASGTAAVARGAAGDVASAQAGHPALPAYARFPQGLPPGWPPPGARPVPCRPAPTEALRSPALAPDPPAPPPAADPLPASERS